MRATQTLAAPLWTWFPHLQKEGLIYMVAVMACSCHFLLLTELQLALGFRVHMGYRRGVGVKGREGDGKERELPETKRERNGLCREEHE